MKPRDFLTFDRMITPAIIRVLYFIGIGVSVLAALGLMISGCTENYGGGEQVVGGFVLLVVGPLLTRVQCELLMLLFKIFDRLGEIRLSLAPDDDCNESSGEGASAAHSAGGTEGPPRDSGASTAQA